MTGISATTLVTPDGRRTILAGGGFVLDISNNADDIVDAQRLRYDVFAAEPGFSDQIGDARTGLDADRFDEFCDHLLVRDTETGSLVGCSRLLPPPGAIAAGGWYSATEFDLSDLDGIRSQTVEMGRACVAGDQRSGSVTALMWAALLDYLNQADYRYLMGCVSVPLDGAVIRGGGAPNPRGADLRGIRDTLLADHAAAWQARPLSAPMVDGVPLDVIAAPSKVVVPPLMRGYLRLGAKVCGDPAVDDVFDVGDFLTVLDGDATSSRYRRRLQDTVLRLTAQGDA
ncbi:GNAT family N-acetyltransferase [Gordonia asplenii]|nr:GNAT family N-acyltransferase [Gordonia asplenii]